MKLCIARPIRANTYDIVYITLYYSTPTMYIYIYREREIVMIDCSIMNIEFNIIDLACKWALNTTLHMLLRSGHQIHKCTVDSYLNIEVNIGHVT